MPTQNQGPASQNATNDPLITQSYVSNLVGANLGLTGATQTQSQIIENQVLTSGSTITLANFTGGPGILTKLHFILFSSGLSNPQIARGLLFSFYVDGETVPSVQFEGDLWSVSQLPTTTTVPSTTTPFVWESDHLALLYGKDGSNNFLLEGLFKYPLPFSSSLTVTVQNQSFVGVSIGQTWFGADAQMGVSTLRRLRSAFTSCNTPAQIPSAVEWQNAQAYVTGNLATFGGVLYQASAGSTGSQPPSANWTAVSTGTNPNFNTGFNLLSVNSPIWLAHLTINGQGPVNGGTYGSANSNSLSFLESNIAIFDGNLTPVASFPGASPLPTYNSSGTEDFMGGSFYWATVGDYNSVINVPSTPFSLPSLGKTKQLRHGFVVSAQSAFMGANVDFLALSGGGLKCGTSCLMRWEQGNLTRAGGSGPITVANTWKVNPTVLYYV